MADIIVGLIVLIAVCLAIRYIYIQKKKGNHCIGCSQSGSCSNCSGKNSF